MYRSQKGQTIVEAIVALVAILIIATAITIVILNGLLNSTFIKNQNEANKLAQQGIELVRDIQQNDLSKFKSYVDAATTHCINEQTSEIYSGSGCSESLVNTNSTFIRTINFTFGGTECNSTALNTSSLKVVVKVAWSSSKCPSSNTFCHKTQLESCMPYIYPASNP